MLDNCYRGVVIIVRYLGVVVVAVVDEKE